MDFNNNAAQIRQDRQWSQLHVHGQGAQVDFWNDKWIGSLEDRVQEYAPNSSALALCKLLEELRDDNVLEVDRVESEWEQLSLVVELLARS